MGGSGSNDNGHNDEDDEGFKDKGCNDKGFNDKSIKPYPRIRIVELLNSKLYYL